MSNCIESRDVPIPRKISVFTIFLGAILGLSRHFCLSPFFISPCMRSFSYIFFFYLLLVPTRKDEKSANTVVCGRNLRLMKSTQFFFAFLCPSELFGVYVFSRVIDNNCFLSNVVLNEMLEFYTFSRFVPPISASILHRCPRFFE